MSFSNVVECEVRSLPINKNKHKMIEFKVVQAISSFARGNMELYRLKFHQILLLDICKHQK